MARRAPRTASPTSGGCVAVAAARLDIGDGQAAVRSARRDPGKLDTELLRARPHRRRRPDRIGPMTPTLLRRRRGRRLHREVADHRSSVRVRALLEVEERRADLHVLAGRGKKLRDPARLRRGDFHHRLLGLDRHERLVDDDMIAFRDMPRDELGLLQPLAQIRQAERRHV